MECFEYPNRDIQAKLFDIKLISFNLQYLVQYKHILLDIRLHKNRPSDPQRI